MIEMKDSGIEWIGEIPKHWDIVRMKSCISQRDSGAWGEEAQGEFGDEICLRIADFNYATFRFKNTPIEELTKRHYTKETIEYLKLQKNDILIEKSGGGEKTPVGRTVIFDKEYTALYANFMDRLRCAYFVLPMFMQYVFVTFYKNDYTRNYIKQTTGIQNLDLTSMLSQESVPLPPIEEQQAIADFLDKQCAEIDSVIEQTKATIEEYKKLKQSVITEAVTKGIRGDRPMKDSGIEWIGEIPENWKVVPIKIAFSEVKTKNTDGAVTNALKFKFGEIVPKTNFDSETDDYVADTILNYTIVEPRMIMINGLNLNYDFKTLRTGLVKEKGIITSAYLALKPIEEIVNAEYATYLFKGYETKMAFHNMGTGIRLTLGFKEFKNQPLLLPPLSEQEAIADFLDQKCAEIDTLIEKKTALLEEMESLKKSTIFEYVTGKKEVVQ